MFNLFLLNFIKFDFFLNTLNIFSAFSLICFFSMSDWRIFQKWALWLTRVMERWRGKTKCAPKSQEVTSQSPAPSCCHQRDSSTRNRSNTTEHNVTGIHSLLFYLIIFVISQQHIHQTCESMVCSSDG